MILFQRCPSRRRSSSVPRASSAGRVFDGVGAINGGDGNSKLLIDHPEHQRERIPDHLFKPGYVTAAQLLEP